MGRLLTVAVTCVILVVAYLNGLAYERQFSRWTEEIGYDLDIGRAGGETSFVSWRIGSA